MNRCVQIDESISDGFLRFFRNPSIRHYTLFYNKEIDIAMAADLNDPVGAFANTSNRHVDG
jgi:hypothetical protein